ncbi:hypothetical protein Rs2_33786 [Raphanus sativus]|nr:hypothetical protein Rs2_33786 [Raphanus sativus]
MNTRETVHAIRKLPLLKAKRYLEDVIALKQAIPSTRFCRDLRRTLQAKNMHSNGQGRWPLKSAQFVLDLLKNAGSNAEMLFGKFALSKDEVAAMFSGLLSSGDGKNSVILVTTVIPKITGGTMFLKSSPATNFFWATYLQPITDFTAGLKSALGEEFPCFHTNQEINEKELASIGDLIKYRSNSDK